MEDTGSGKVSYTVKELIEKVDHKLDRIVEQIATKADSDDLAKLAGAHQLLVSRVDSLESNSASEAKLDEYRVQQEKQRKSDRKWMIGMAVTTTLGVVGLVASLIFNLFP